MQALARKCADRTCEAHGVPDAPHLLLGQTKPSPLPSPEASLDIGSIVMLEVVTGGSTAYILYAKVRDHCWLSHCNTVMLTSTGGCRMCRICAEKFPNKQCNADIHRCSACIQEFPTRAWPKIAMRKHTRFPRRMLICTTCKENGYMASNVNTYKCKNCGNCMGCGKFEDKDLKNAKARGKLARLGCSRCKMLIKCATCKKEHGKEYWSRKARNNTKSKGSALICKQCRHLGCTSRDPALYTCTTCSGMFGAAKLDPKSFVNFKSHGRRTLTCSNCVTAQKTRVKSLQSQLERSTRKCTCFGLFHRALCPLSPCIYSEGWWPGNDGFISLDDKIFLDRLNPQPQWWLKAWGRTE